MQKTIHESFSREEPVVGSSDRSFGIVMTAAFLVMSLLNWWHGGHSWRWTGGTTVIFLITTLIYPTALRPLSRLWLKFGLLVHRVVNPILMAFVFFGTVLPTGLVMRTLGKDPLRLRRQPDADTYWIERRPPGPAAESMEAEGWVGRSMDLV